MTEARFAHPVGVVGAIGAGTTIRNARFPAATASLAIAELVIAGNSLSCRT